MAEFLRSDHNKIKLRGMEADMTESPFLNFQERFSGEGYLMKYLYKIAGISIIFEVPFAVTIREESKEFVMDSFENDEADIYFQFRGVQNQLEMPVGGHWETQRYHVETDDEWKVYHCPQKNDLPYICVTKSKKSPKMVYCDYVIGKESYLNYSRNLIEILEIGELLLAHSGLLLHSSFIRWHGKGILFSAPSGVGKSTQAELWKKYENADIVNGDKAAVRYQENKWHACGLPFAGTSGIYRNQIVPVEMIVILRQAKQNQIHKLTSKEAFRHLYPEILLHPWKKQYIESALELLSRVISEIPIYLLECLPEEGAVRVVKDELLCQTGEEKEHWVL